MSVSDPFQELISKERVFSLPTVMSDDAGWGPSAGPDSLREIPYAPFQKTDRLGRVSDWISSNKYYNNKNNKTFGAGTGGFGFSQGAEEDFAYVDNTPRNKPRDGRRRYAKYSVHNKRRRGRGNRRYHSSRGRGGSRGRGRQATNSWGRRRWGQQEQEQKPPSIPIQDSWELLGMLDHSDLNKIAMNPPTGRTLLTAGKIQKYNRAIDTAMPKKPIQLRRFESKAYVTATTSEDPVLQRLQAEGKGTVFATDTILAVLMTAGRSVQAWDLSVTKKNGVITIDKRAGSSVDFLTVNENWNEVQETDLKSINHPTNLCTEATLINHNFSQAVLDTKAPAVDCDEENPFSSLVAEQEEPASMGYRYRQWKIAEGCTVVARCEVNGYEVKNGEKVFLTVQALNSFDHTLSGGVDWRQKLSTAAAAVFASEMKNNNCKLAKFAAKLEMAGTDELRLGFVARKETYGGSLSHEVLLVRKYKPDTFITQMQMQTSRLWASAKRILDLIMEQEDGQFVLLLNPNVDPKQARVHLYRVPEGPVETNEAE